MRGGLARRMCSDTENSIFPPSVVVVVIGKSSCGKRCKKPSRHSLLARQLSVRCRGNAPFLDSSWITAFIQIARNAIGERIVEMEGDCKGVGITLSRQVVRSPIQAGGYDPGDQFKPR